MQRVLEAKVVVDGRTVGEIDHGLVVLASVEKDDAPADVEWTAAKLATMRIFRSADGDKHFDRDVKQVGGSILLVSNFTVSAGTKKGRRPDLERAAEPKRGRELFSLLVDAVKAQGIVVATGEFGADMRVALTNDGPVTFVVNSK